MQKVPQRHLLELASQSVPFWLASHAAHILVVHHAVPTALDVVFLCLLHHQQQGGVNRLKKALWWQDRLTHMEIPNLGKTAQMRMTSITPSASSPFS
jgi:hypothetical protein